MNLRVTRSRTKKPSNSVPRTQTTNTSKRNSIHFAELEAEHKQRDSGKYYYCSFTPADKKVYSYIDNECSRLGVPIEYSDLPSGARVYRVDRIAVGRLPTGSGNLVSYGLPKAPEKNKLLPPWPLAYANALDCICKIWIEVPMRRRRQRG